MIECGNCHRVYSLGTLTANDGYQRPHLCPFCRHVGGRIVKQDRTYGEYVR